MHTGGYYADSHGHERNLDGRPLRSRSVHKPLLAVDKVIVGQYLLIESFFEARFDYIRFGFCRNNNEVVASCMANIVSGGGTLLVNHLSDEHRGKTDHIVACHETIYIFK